MQEEISYAILVISVGLTAFGIMLSTTMRRKYPARIVSSLIYYQAFVFAFGFYGLWGQAVFRLYITDLLNEDVREKISMVATLQGFPFMILAWYMLVKFMREIYQRKTGVIFNIVFLAFSAISLGSLIWFISQPDTEASVFYYAFYTILSIIIQGGICLLIILLKPKNKRIEKNKMLILAGIIIVLTTIQLLILNITNMQGYYALGFILLFFVLHSVVAIYTRYTGLLDPFRKDMVSPGSFDLFCEEFEVSPRESEIIREICKGLTNKEISETLFISLQTVKDHTHRIYIKTGVRNRVELINRLKEVL